MLLMRRPLVASRTALPIAGGTATDRHGLRRGFVEPRRLAHQHGARPLAGIDRAAEHAQRAVGVEADLPEIGQRVEPDEGGWVEEALAEQEHERGAPPR